jgi:hypothetical protein
MAETVVKPFMVTDEQARLLKSAMSTAGIERVEAQFGKEGDILALNMLLDKAIKKEGEPISVPGELNQVLGGCARLVIQSELDYVGGLVRTGRVAELAGRMSSAASLDHKLAKLTPLIDRSVAFEHAFLGAAHI